jgi:signal transduction histidine kinase
LSKRVVLRAGYGAVMVVLVLSAVEAYRIQTSLSEQHLEIYRSYVDQEQSLTTLRRNLWLEGNDVRDFFINSTPAQAEILRSQLAAMRTEDDEALRHMEATQGRRDVVLKLRRSLQEFWSIADPVPAKMLNASDAEKFDFLQRVIVPRRGELYSVLVALSSADQQKLQDSESEFSDTRRHAAERLMLMLGLGLLLSLVVMRISLRHAENLEQQAEKQYAEVERTKQELQQLSASLLEVEEEDRRRLSRELHDEIGQALALLQIEISHVLAAPEQAGAMRERLERARELASRTVQTVRNISLLLRPALLDDLGLVPALQFQLEEFLRRSGVACEFVEEGVAEQLPDHVKTCVFRVVQEALHNCEKHAHASKVRLSVRQTADSLLAEVEDDGRGFVWNPMPQLSRGTGLGLLGMRERAVRIGGVLVVDSIPGRGTRIALRIPLAQAVDDEPQVSKEVTV